MLKASRTEKEAGDLLGTYLLQGWVSVHLGVGWAMSC